MRINGEKWEEKVKKRGKKANNRPGRGANGNFLGAAESRTLPSASAPSRSRTFRSRPFPAPAALPRLHPDGIHVEFPASGGSEPPFLGLFQLFPLFPLNCSRLFGVFGFFFFCFLPPLAAEFNLFWGRSRFSRRFPLGAAASSLRISGISSPSSL